MAAHFGYEIAAPFRFCCRRNGLADLRRVYTHDAQPLDVPREFFAYARMAMASASVF